VSIQISSHLVRFAHRTLVLVACFTHRKLVLVDIGNDLTPLIPLSFARRGGKIYMQEGGFAPLNSPYRHRLRSHTRHMSHFLVRERREGDVCNIREDCLELPVSG